MSAQTLINALSGVKSRGPGKWICKCPAHQDRTASLSVSETQDGRTLLKCFAGCDTEAILHAVGLEFADLFPERLDNHPPQRRRAFTAADLLNIVHTEINVAAILASDLARGVQLSDTDQRRIEVCAARLNQAAMELMG